MCSCLGMHVFSISAILTSFWFVSDEEAAAQTELSDNTDGTVRSFHGAEVDRCHQCRT